MMWNWLRKVFGTSSASNPQPSREPAIPEDVRQPLRLSELTVELDPMEESDPAACLRLLRRIEALGARTIDDAEGVAVSLEDFFEGNGAKHSIAANVVPAPPYDTADAWYRHLQSIRSREDVADVLVAIAMIEPFSDGRLGSWPYADTVWVYSPLPASKVEGLLAPLEPSEVEAAAADPDRHPRPPHPPGPGVTAYRVWWD